MCCTDRPGERQENVRCCSIRVRASAYRGFVHSEKACRLRRTRAYLSEAAPRKMALIWTSSRVGGRLAGHHQSHRAIISGNLTSTASGKCHCEHCNLAPARTRLQRALVGV